jgi:TolA-binding protein
LSLHNKPKRKSIDLLMYVVIIAAASGIFTYASGDALSTDHIEQLRQTKKFKEFESLASTAFNKAMNLYKDEKYFDAAVKFKEVVLLYPSFSQVDRATFMMGESYYQASMYVESAQAFNRILKNFATSEFEPRALYRLELCSLKMERYNAAIAYYEQLEMKYPQSPDIDGARYFGGLAFYAIDDFDSCNKVMAMLSSESEYYGFGQYTVALCYLREGLRNKDVAGGVDKAINQLDKVIQIKKRSAVGRALVGKAHVTLGQLHYQMGRYDEAEDEFKRIPGRDGHNYDNAQFGLGWCKIKRTELTEDPDEIKDNFKDAAKYMRRIINDLGGSELYAEAYLTLAHCYLGTGDYDKAIETYRYVIDNFSLAADFAGDPQVSKVLEGIITEIEKVKRINTALQELNSIAKRQGRDDIITEIREEQKEVSRLLEDLNELELWFTGRSISGGNVMLGADYGLATISFREGEEIEKELIAYDMELSEKLGKARDEIGRLEKEVHVHELKLDELPLGQPGTAEDTPEGIYRRRIEKYNVIPEQGMGTSDIPGELPPLEYEAPEPGGASEETGPEIIPTEETTSDEGSTASDEGSTASDEGSTASDEGSTAPDWGSEPGGAELGESPPPEETTTPEGETGTTTETGETETTATPSGDSEEPPVLDEEPVVPDEEPVVPEDEPVVPEDEVEGETVPE